MSELSHTKDSRWQAVLTVRSRATMFPYATYLRAPNGEHSNWNSHETFFFARLRHWRLSRQATVLTKHDRARRALTA